MWTEADKSDSLHQVTFKEFSLLGKFLIPPQQSNLPAPLLVLHCQPGPHRFGRVQTNGHFVEGWIAVGAVLNPAEQSVGRDAARLVPVEFRLDEKKLQADLWPVSTDHLGVFLNGPHCRDCTLNNLLYGHMLPHKDGTNPQVRRIILGVPEYLGAQVQMQFDLPDSTQFAEACGVIVHKR
jgi:hypothetical protein